MEDKQNLIKNYREKANMTQQELAEKIGVNARSIRRWESGESAPDVYSAMAIAAIFGLQIEDIFDV